MKLGQGSGTRKKLQDFSYCLAHNIGKGYSSHVYKGRNDLTNETVAIKVIDMKMLKGQVHRNLLASEIDVLKSFKRAKHIIEVYQIYSTKNNTYIITEFCDGGDLSKTISGRRGMPENEALELFTEIIQGYSEIYANKVIHRDLKPANILLRDNKVKIADFGFAMKCEDCKKYSSYNVGSPIYMPPEALNQNKYSYKSDVWALGVIYYQLLTGKTPWKAKTEKQLGHALNTVPISKLLPKNISQASKDFLQGSLCVNFEKRMGPEELIRYLDTFTKNSITNTTSTTSHLNYSYNAPTPDTSLTKNIVQTPKNMRRFAFLKGGCGDDINNTTLPKTASTINDASQKNILPLIDKKKVSKELLSQVHFCRFVYKLLQRIDTCIDGDILEDVRDSMGAVLFYKLSEVEKLSLVERSHEYKKSSDYTKIFQIVSQYQSKYENDVSRTSWPGFETFQSLIVEQIRLFYQKVQTKPLDEVKNHVIILDYFITLKQLISILSKDDLELFNVKSKIETIVEGSPSKVITGEHVRAITAKLRAIKIL